MSFWHIVILGPVLVGIFLYRCDQYGTDRAWSLFGRVVYFLIHAIPVTIAMVMAMLFALSFGVPPPLAILLILLGLLSFWGFGRRERQSERF